LQQVIWFWRFQDQHKPFATFARHLVKDEISVFCKATKLDKVNVPNLLSQWTGKILQNPDQAV
jgi:hypothetical protein